MPNFRAQVRLQGASMLPEDVFVNTYHFVRLDALEAAAAALTPQLEALYDTLNTWFFPEYIQRTVECRFYDLADAEPRVPEITEFTLAAATPPSTVPFEVCSVVSFHGAPPVTGRRRGRVFLGPIGAGNVVNGSSISPPVMSAAARGGTATAFSTFLALGNGWSIRSTVPAENFVPVVGGWVDNEYDTVRSRGHTATVRQVWP